MPSTRVIPVDPDGPDPSAIAEAATILRAGGLVAFATETVYGLGADATSPEAVARIFEAWVARRVSRHTRRAYRQDVRSFIAFQTIAWPDDAIRLLQTSVADVHAWRDHLITLGAAPKTLNRRIASLSSFYKYLQGITEIDGVNNAGEFKDTIEAMDIIGFDKTEKDSIWAIVSACMLYGNLNFSSGKRDDAASFTDTSGTHFPLLPVLLQFFFFFKKEKLTFFFFLCFPSR